MLFSALALVASRFPLRVPGHDRWLSISDTFFMTSALLFGPAPATATVAIDSLVMSSGASYRGCGDSCSTAARRRSRSGLARRSSSGCPASGPLFGTHAPGRPHCRAAGGFGRGLLTLLNSGLTAIAVALEKGTVAAGGVALALRHGLAQLLRRGLGGVLARPVVVKYLSLLALAAVVPLFAIVHLAMRSWTGRLEDAEEHVATVDRLYLSTIGALSTAIEAKDGVTSSHIHRVQHYAMGLAKALGSLDEQTLKAIQAAALLHDTGKLAVPERILNKPGKLTPAEFETMKLHVDVGADILSSIDFPYPVVPIVRAHHENWDGSGYPNGLKGTRHSDRRAHPVGRRLLRRADLRSPVSRGDDRRRSARHHPRPPRHDVRPGRRRHVRAGLPRHRAAGGQAAAAEGDRQDQQGRRFGAPSRRSIAAARGADGAPANEGPESLRALANLARVVSGRPSTADVVVA